MTGTTGAAWNDPVKGGELAKAQIDRGADVVYHAAGGTGIGVLQAAADAGKLGIGVDSNQNYLHPGTGADLDGEARRRRRLQRLQDAQERQVDRRHRRCWASPRTASAGRSTRTTRPLITPEMKAAVDEAKADRSSSGAIQVHDYMADNVPVRRAEFPSSRCGPVGTRGWAWPREADGTPCAEAEAHARDRADRHRQALRCGPRQQDINLQVERAPSTASSARTAPASRR